MRKKTISISNKIMKRHLKVWNNQFHDKVDPYVQFSLIKWGKRLIIRVVIFSYLISWLLLYLYQFITFLVKLNCII